MARKTSENSVSLFPFLAVLVCTMGALILLLLLTTRRIQKQQSVQGSIVDSSISLELEDIEDSFGLTVATDVPQMVSDSQQAEGQGTAEESDGDAPDEPPQFALTVPEVSTVDDSEFSVFGLSEPELPEPTSFELKVEIDRLNVLLQADEERHAALMAEIAAAEQKLKQPDSDEELKRQAGNLQNLKQQEGVLKSQLDAQQVTIAGLEGELDQKSETTEDAEQILRARESALVSLRQLADEASSSRRSKAASTLLEFSNSTGTSQRPLVVNVSEEGFRFSPADVLVPADQMDGAPQDMNPLLAGITALHQQMQPQSATAAPYVLLLVRPDGSLPFYSAQRILKNAGVNFGYELIEQDRSVFVGKPAAGEKEVLQRAVDSAIKRRNEMYGGMLAEVQRLRSRAEERPKQQARMMPDGRITVPGEKDHDLPGRFFAGGERPPMEELLVNNTRRTSPFQQPAQSDESPNPFSNPFANPSSSTQDTVAESAAGSMQDAIATSGDAAGQFPTEEIPNPFAVREMSESATSAAASAGNGDDLLQIEELLANNTDRANDETVGSQSSPMTDSLMAGGFTQPNGADANRSNVPNNASLIPSDNFQNAMAQESSTPPNRIDPDWLNQSPITTSQAPIVEPGSQTPPDWSESVTAPADAASRTVGAAENPNTSQPNAQMANGQPPGSANFMATLEANANGGSLGPMFGEHEESALSKFMRRLDSEIESNRPDPFLVSVLETAKAKQVAQNRHARQPVTIILQGSTLKVGRSAVMQINGLSEERVLAATLEKLVVEMQASRSIDGSLPMPTIDFQTDAASEALRFRLQQELERMDVTTRSSSLLPVPAIDPKLEIPEWPPFDGVGPKRESATPMKSSPSVRTPGGLSI